MITTISLIEKARQCQDLTNQYICLYLQGFCVPPELSDEVCGEGATEFTDYEQAGLGEGEGVKNVSDEIEDEDQVWGKEGFRRSSPLKDY